MPDIKRAYTLKIDPELLAALRKIKERVGIPESEQIRRGIRLWLRQSPVLPHVRPIRRRPRTRSRKPKAK